MNKKTIFLDRDGTLIVDKDYLNDPNLVEFLPNAIAGLKKLKELGYIFIVVTNQSGIFRGLVTEEQMHAIHQRMDIELAKHNLEIAAYYFSPEGPDSKSLMRKPNSGMIEQAIIEHGVDRQNSWMIGDKMSDVEAGHRAKLKTIFLHGKENPRDSNFQMAEYELDDLLQAANQIANKA